MKSYWETMKEDNKQKRIEKIFQSAFKIFSKKGFYETRMEDIAKDAGISKGTVYIYFSSKEELFIELFRYIALGSFNNIKEIKTIEGSNREKLLALIHQYELIFSNEDMLTLFVIMTQGWSALLSMKKLKDLFNDIYNELIYNFKDIVEEGIKTKEFNPINAKYFMSMLGAIYDGLGLQVIIGLIKPEEIKELFEAVRDILFKGIDYDPKPEDLLK